jgi:16S rRNA (adenine1518-N6/adenine1519-N6)-dimethyltransferase
MVRIDGIATKKKYGQHFLRDESVVNTVVKSFDITADSSVFEIGCGDGFLTRRILESRVGHLRVFEIDPEWAQHVIERFQGDDRLQVETLNFLDLDLAILEENAPWIVLSNLPYNITFPILNRFVQIKDHLLGGVVMVQEEVAQKIVKTGGRGFGAQAMYLQYFFDWELLQSVPASAFVPAPKVTSRLIKFTPRAKLELIPDPKLFWKFVRLCFVKPRKTLKNNLITTHFKDSDISDEVLALRAQQMNFTQLLELWKHIK